MVAIFALNSIRWNEKWQKEMKFLRFEKKTSFEEFFQFFN